MKVKQLLNIALCTILMLTCMAFTALAAEADEGVYNVYFELDTYTAAAPVEHGMSFTEMYPDVDPYNDLVPQKDYHTFIGWYESTDGGETFKDTPYDFGSEVTGDVTLYPLFEINVYDVYFELDTYTAAAPVEHGMSFTEMYPDVDPYNDLVPQKDYHTFIGWYESTDGGETFKDTPYDFGSEVTGDVTLYPLFEINVYNVYFELDTYTAAAPVEHGMSFTEMYPDVDPYNDLVPQKDYHTFIGWYESTDGGETFKDTPYDFGSEVTGDVTLYPLFEIFTYTVTYKADGAVIATAEVEHGKDSAAPEIPEKDGCTAVWDKDGKNITADTEINAVYTKIPATGDNTNLWVWLTLLFVSGGAIFGIALNERKRRS